MYPVSPLTLISESNFVERSESSAQVPVDPTMLPPLEPLEPPVLPLSKVLGILSHVKRMLPVRLPPAPVSLGEVAASYEVPAASLGAMTTWAGATSLGSFAEKYAGCWPYPPLNVPVATAWTKPGYWSGVRYMRAVVSGNPYGNGPYTVKTNTPWWGYQDTDVYYGDVEQGIVGLVTRGTEGMDIYCSQDGLVLSADADGGPFILQLDLPRPVTVFYYKLVARSGASVEQNPGKWTLEGSDDEVTWHQVDAREGVAGWTFGMVRHFQVAEKRTHRYWRLVVTRIAIGTNLLSVAGLTLFAPQLRDPLPFDVTGGTPRFTAYAGATVFPDGGLDNGPRLDLDSAQSQYMRSTTPVVAAFRTNGTGLTFATVAKFGAALSDYEWVFGFGYDYLLFGRGNGTAVGVVLPYGEYLESAQGAIVQDQWATWTFRMNLNGVGDDDYRPADLTVWKDGQVVAQGTVPFDAASLGDQTFDSMYIGTSVYAIGYTYMTGSVKNAFLYDWALSDSDLAQLQAYATYDTGEPPEGPVAVFDAATALGITPYEEFSPATFTPYGVTAVESGGPNDEARVLFNRDFGHYAQGVSPITASFSANGGLTLTVVARFEGAVGEWERLVDYGNGQAQSVYLTRLYNFPNPLFFAFGVQLEALDAIVQEEWATWTVRVIDQTSVEMWKDGVLVASLYEGVIGLPDVVLSTPYVGKSFYNDPTLGGSIKTAIMYDRALSDPEITQLQQYALDGTGDPPSTPVSVFSAASLTSSGPYVAQPVTMPSPVTFVTYNSPAVTNAGIRFRRDNKHYAAGSAPITAAFGTNGGMTMSFVLRFEDTAGAYESILGVSDDRTAYETNTTAVERFDTNGMIYWDSNGGADYRELILNETVEQDVWATWTFRVTGDLLEAWKDDVLIGSSTGFTMNDRSSLLAELGRYASEQHLNGTIKVFVLYDRPLSDIELAALHSYVTDDLGTLPPSPTSLCSPSTVG